MIRSDLDFLKITLFIFGCAGSSLLCGLFSCCGDWGATLVGVHGAPIVVASLVEYEL